jgi:hypothetical protein
LNRITLAAAMLFLSACSTATFTSPPYTSSIETTSVLKSLGVANIEIKSVTSSIDIDNTCPSSAKIILLPNNSSFEDYIKSALIEELSAAKIHDREAPKVKLQIDIKELEYFLAHSNSLMSVWDIDLKVNSSNGTSLRIHKHYLFDAGAYSLWSCKKIAESYMPAIQATIFELANSPKLKALVTP